MEYVMGQVAIQIVGQIMVVYIVIMSVVLTLLTVKRKWRPAGAGIALIVSAAIEFIALLFLLEIDVYQVFRDLVK